MALGLQLLFVACAAVCIKYIDDARDDGSFPVRWIPIALVFANVSACVTIVSSSWGCAFWIAVILGCLAAGKVDIAEFRVSAALILPLGVWRVIDSGASVAPMFLWTTCACADELLNSAADRMRPTVAKWVCHYKPAFPLVALISFLVFGVHGEILAGVLVFDAAYGALGVCGAHLAKVRGRARASPWAGRALQSEVVPPE